MKYKLNTQMRAISATSMHVLVGTISFCNKLQNVTVNIQRRPGEQKDREWNVDTPGSWVSGKVRGYGKRSVSICELWTLPCRPIRAVDAKLNHIGEARRCRLYLQLSATFPNQKHLEFDSMLLVDYLLKDVGLAQW